MSKSIEATGKTLDDAIRAALTQLGVDRDEVTVEVLEKGKSGFLGIGGTPSRIRATLLTDLEDAPPVAVPTPPPAPAPVKQQSAPPRPAAPPPKPKPAPAQAKAPQPKPTQATAQPKPVPAASQSKPAPKLSANDGKPGEHRRRRQESNHPATPEQIEKAVALLSGILQRMGLEDAQVTARQEERYLYLDVTGTGLGRLIGRRGNTLDAVQRLCGNIVNRGEEKHTRLVVDTEQYRQKREDALVRLAHKTAEKAVRYRSNVALEPMNSYARHIIHTALQDNNKVTTHSVGNEPNRRVVVAVPGGNENRHRHRG